MSGVLITAASVAASGFWEGLAAWPGWNMTGAVAGVLAAFAIIPAVIRYFRDRHRANVGMLSLSTYGTASRGGFTYHLGELGNEGGAAVNIVAIGLVHAHGAWTDLGEQARWWLGVGDSIKVPYLVRDEQKAWMLVMYVGVDNLSRSRTVWMPLFGRSEAEEAYRASFDAYPPRRWWQAWRWMRRASINAVGPGGAPSSARRIHPTHGDINLVDVMQIFTAEGGNLYWAGTAAKPKPAP